MRTPLQSSYGKRKRHLGTPEISWDATIDRHINNNSPTPAWKTTSNDSGTRVETGVADEVESTQTIKSSSPEISKKFDVYDFNTVHKAARDHGRMHHTLKTPTRTIDAASRATSELSKGVLLPAAFDADWQTPTANRSMKGIGKGDAELSSAENAKQDRAVRVSSHRYSQDATIEPRLSKAEARALSYLEAGPSRESLRSAVVRSPSHQLASEGRTGLRTSPRRPVTRVVTTEEQSLERVPTQLDMYSDAAPVDRDYLDANPIARSTTPVSQQISAIPLRPSPQPSPTSHAIHDLFPDREDALQSNSRPRRVLRQLSRLGSSPVKRSRSSLHEEINESRIDKLLEDAENNLLEQSQSQSSLLEDAPILSIALPIFEETVDQQLRARAPNGAKITYSKQRSFLAESAPEVIESASKAPNPQSQGGASDTESDDICLASPKAVKNVHDLRHGGLNKRFLDQASYLLEGLESTSTFLSTLLELGHKMSNQEFARHFCTANLQDRLWRSCQDRSDPISLFAASVVMTTLMQHMESPRADSAQRYVINSALAHEKDIQDYLQDKSLRVSKMNKLSLKDVRSLVTQSPVFQQLESGYKLSPRLLSLMSMNICNSYGETAEDPDDLIEELLRDVAVDPTSSPLNVQLITGALETFPVQCLCRLSRAQITKLVEVLLELLHIESPSIRVITPICSILRLLISISNEADSKLQARLSDEFAIQLLNFILSDLDSQDVRTSDAEITVLVLGLLVSLVDNSWSVTLSVIRHLVTDSTRNHKLLEFIRAGLNQTADPALVGYTALLFFHLCYSERVVSSSELKTRLVADRDLVRAGLELLRRTVAPDLSVENEFLSTISRYIVSL